MKSVFTTLEKEEKVRMLRQVAIDLAFLSKDIDKANLSDIQFRTGFLSNIIYALIQEELKGLPKFTDEQQEKDFRNFHNRIEQDIEDMHPADCDCGHDGKNKTFN